MGEFIVKRLWNIIFWVVIAGLSLVILYNLYNRYKPEVELKQVPPQQTEDIGKAEENQEPEKVMAPDFTLQDINGKEVKLSSYRGKIVVLNFWAVWCPYCIQEMPGLDAANTELLKGEDAVILTVDVQEDLEKVKKFISSKKLTLPVLMDYDGSVSGAYGVSAFPTTFVINRDGSVYGYQTGPITKEQILNLVDKMK